MTPASSARVGVPTFERSARLLGVASSALALSLATLAALAINDLVHREVPRGVELLLAVVVLRWALASALEEWGESTSERLRGYWRAAIVGHLAVPRRAGDAARGDLALAIDRASFSPSLERLGVSAASALLGVVVIFFASGWLPFLITVALVTLAVPLYRRAGVRSEARATEFHERRALLESRQLEVLQHAPDLRALGAVEYGAREIAALSDSEHVLALRAIRVALESSLVTEFLSGVSVGLVAMVVGFGLLDGRLSLLRALIAVLVTAELFAQVRRFGVEFHRRDDASGARAVLLALTPLPRPGAGGDLLYARNLVTEAGPREITLRLAAGDRLVVTGASGAGKTTLLHTLLGWRPAVAGSVERTDAPIGYLDAELALLSGTLRENLTLGVAIEDAEVVARLTSLGLSGERFTDLEACLLSDGRGLSTGERVRLLLARALLAGATLLVLDDVAGVLDHEARRKVREVLDQRGDVAILEATVDTPLIASPTRRLVLGP